MIERALDRVRTDRVAAAVLIAVAAYCVLYWVPGSPLPSRMPWGVVTQGLIFGASYALLAMGLILIYRSTRIVNFAYGAMGAMPGAVTVGLFVGQGWNYGVAIVIGVALGVVSGALVDILVIRRFADSSRLVLTVASIGLAQVLGAIGLGIGVALGTDFLIGNLNTPLSWSFFVRPYRVRGDHILMVAVVPVALSALAWFLLRTRTGIAVRAAAENRERALLLGVPAPRLQTMVWAIAGGLSTLSYVTRVPFTGLVPDAIVGVTVILPGLAAAVIARFRSLPTALAAGLGLGLAEWTIRWNVSATSLFDVTFFVVILVALLFGRREESRADDAESSWDTAGVLRAIPAELRRLPEVRGALIACGTLVAGFALIVPLYADPSAVVLMSFAAIWAMVALSLVVLTGWGGNISLGQFALVGAAAMMAGNLFQRHNADFFVAAVGASITGAVVAVAIGLPALRIRGLYLAVTTLAFAVALDSYFLNPVNFPNLVPDRVVQPVLIKRFGTDSPWVSYYVCLAALLGVVGVLRAVRNRRAGRVAIATRDNERAAAAFGVPTTRLKLQTFVLAGAITGLAGCLYVMVLSGAGQGTFKPVMSVEVFAYAVIGGLESISGAIAGVIFFRGLDYVLSETLSGTGATIVRLSLSGTGLLVVLYFLPGGVWQLVQAGRDRFLRRVAARRNLLVPSLIADRRADDDATTDDISAGEMAEIADRVAERESREPVDVSSAAP